MANLQDLINLAKADGGKFFVMDESGEAKLVIMSIEDYQKMLLGKLQRQVQEVEKINKEIIRAQLGEEIFPSAPKNVAVPLVSSKIQDLREEVIDPSFNFESEEDDL